MTTGADRSSGRTPPASTVANASAAPKALRRDGPESQPSNGGSFKAEDVPGEATNNAENDRSADADNPPRPGHAQRY